MKFIDWIKPGIKLKRWIMLGGMECYLFPLL